MFANFYAAAYDRLNSEKNYKDEIEFVYEWAKNPKMILDVGCGTASYWKYWPLGAHVYGLEKSKSMIHESVHKNRIFYGDVCRDGCAGLLWYFDLMTALFHVVNYTPHGYWWGDMPLKKDGYFIFDVLDKKKVRKDGFQKTTRTIGDYEPNQITRTITPVEYHDDFVVMDIEFDYEGEIRKEQHKLFLHSEEDIRKFAGNNFEIVDVKPTETWTTWYKLKRK